MATEEEGGLILQIPASRHRYHYVKAKVRVHRYADGNLAVFHGPRKLSGYKPGREDARLQFKTGRLSRPPGASPCSGTGSGHALHRFPNKAEKRTIHVLQNRTILKTRDIEEAYPSFLARCKVSTCVYRRTISALLWPVMLCTSSNDKPASTMRLVASCLRS